MAKHYRGNRFEVDWSLSVKYNDEETAAARVVNVSAGGIFFACPFPLRTGNIVQIRFTDHWGEQVNATVTVVWTRSLETGGTGYGCRFEELADVDRRILNSLLCELLQKQIEQAASGKTWSAEDGSRLNFFPERMQKAA